MILALTWLDARMSFEIAALIATWLALVFVTLIALNLHFRMMRLERDQAEMNHRTAYAHVHGRQLGPWFAEAGIPAPRYIFLFSANCETCKRLIEEFNSLSWTERSVIAWTDHPPPLTTVLPAAVQPVDRGARLAAELRIRVTPFFLELDEDGRIVRAAPATSLSALRPSYEATRIPVHPTAR